VRSGAHPASPPPPRQAEEAPAATIGDLELYRQQHRELLAAAGLLGARLELGSLATPDEHARTRTLLARLAGKLTVHLQMEDLSLYPELLRSGRAELRATALRFQDEMGSIRAAAEVLFRRWLGPSAIELAPEAFAEELRPLLGALAARIASEETGLFPLADRLA
jgi:hypothetical protein